MDLSVSAILLSDLYRTGDHLKVARPGSQWVHEGIYLVDGQVIHVESGRVAEIVGLMQFAHGTPPSLASRARTIEEGELRVARAIRRLGHPYHPMSFNCQHLANEAVTGAAYSQTVSGAVVLGLLLLGIGATNRPC